MMRRGAVFITALVICLGAGFLLLEEPAPQVLSKNLLHAGNGPRDAEPHSALKPRSLNRSARTDPRHNPDDRIHVRDYLGPVDEDYVFRLDTAQNNGYRDEVVASISAALHGRQLTFEQASQSVERLVNLRPHEAALLNWAASILAESIAQDGEEDPTAALEKAMLHVIYRLQDLGEFEAALRMANAFNRDHPNRMDMQVARVMSLTRLDQRVDAREQLDSIVGLPGELLQYLKEAIAGDATSTEMSSEPSNVAANP
jgi:hypothetical protein